LDREKKGEGWGKRKEAAYLRSERGRKTGRGTNRLQPAWHGGKKEEGDQGWERGKDIFSLRGRTKKGKKNFVTISLFFIR